MRDHSFDQRLGELAHAWFARTKIPELIELFRTAALLKIAPKVVLNGGFPALRRFPIVISAAIATSTEQLQWRRGRLPCRG
jgi:hypothetical protein